MPRNPVEKCDTTFEDRYGSTTPGNLPTDKTKVCIENTITISGVQAEFPWVTINDFHFYHLKCPYSNEATINYVRDIDTASATYWQMLEVAPASRGNHTTTSGFMIKHSKGSKHGWLCVDPDCPYYQLNKRNYFYI